MRRGPTVGALIAALAIGVSACASVTAGTPTAAAPPAAAAAMAAAPTSSPTASPGSAPAAVASTAEPTAPTAEPTADPTAGRPPTTSANDPGVTAAPAAVDPSPPADTPSAISTSAETGPTPAPAPDPPNWSDASDADIRAAAGAAVEVTERFWSESFAARIAAGSSSAAWSSPELWTGDGFYDSAAGTVADCGDGRNYVGNAFFCGNATTGTGFLAWDLQFFHQHLDLGRTMVDMVIAHETGHAVQARLVHDGVAGALFDGSRRYELQADCLGGASLGRAVRDGYLTLPATARDEMLRVASAFGGDAAGHGTPEQRDDSFQRGFATGELTTCLTDPES